MDVREGRIKTMDAGFVTLSEGDNVTALDGVLVHPLVHLEPE